LGVNLGSAGKTRSLGFAAVPFVAVASLLLARSDRGSGNSPGFGCIRRHAFSIHSTTASPICTRRRGTAMTTDHEHKAGMASGELLDRIRSKRAEVDKYVEANLRRRRFLV